MKELIPKYSFRLFWSESDSAFIATCPEFPGLSAFGKTEVEALREAKIALGLFIEDMREDSVPLPEPQVPHYYSGQTRLRLSKTLHQQAAEMAEAEGESLNQFIAGAVQARVSSNEASGKLIQELRNLVAQFQTNSATVTAAIVGKRAIGRLAKVETIDQLSVDASPVHRRSSASKPEEKKPRNNEARAK
jgi:predicted RNase H-like HicB family nuclease